MIMIFDKRSIYGDVFILIFTEYCYIKWLWYLIKDQYMEMCSFWYLQRRLWYCWHKMIMIFGQRINIWRCVYFDIYRVLWHKMIMIFVKGSIYGDVFILIFTEWEYFLHKIIMIFLKGSIYADLYILIFTEESIFT